ncbi:MAG: hypothetical protein HY290_05485 [Planctomycetia bacterium]|nr:hypothetical protein [Planctomycetia bacterium]
MSSIPANGTGYSAHVRLHLLVGDDSYELASIGPGGVSIREPIELPAGPAEVVMHVDDFERRWQVYLPDGISANSREVRTVPASPADSAAL